MFPDQSRHAVLSVRTSPTVTMIAGATASQTLNLVLRLLIDKDEGATLLPNVAIHLIQRNHDVVVFQYFRLDNESRNPHVYFRCKKTCYAHTHTQQCINQCIIRHEHYPRA